MKNQRYVPVKGDKMTTYVFRVALEPDGAGWRAFYAPMEHIGASTWGATREEAVRHIHEVLAMIVDELLEERKEVPAAEELLVTTGAAVAITR